ncbi:MULTISPECIES: aldehyde dehydrogenase family protein [unclassified Psychrobacter]|uniref:aldehyde dehydrogenase family protein n=1 Tax=unclassified Psychrobacter TaxID=196806 RepID=UPI0025B4DB58|nr:MULTISPECIES: aldehyde dehydrogenase family protein [unclassified Psychrobacter]MDN3453978.1 aldehyde dehydrogenase family protein [Psychrobacter sp. APC 3350]MDN3503254.1 aldehyde dehydrogenase family protein [Psychrobacter sp. 5A.1]
MEMLNSIDLTRETAIQTAQNEVVLNAAYINGNWVTIEALTTDADGISSNNINSDNAENHALYDPNSGKVIATTRLCTSAHVEIAVQAASEASASWSQTTVSERAHYLNAIADSMEQQFDTLVGLSVLNNGKPIEEAKIDVGDAMACYRYYANLITDQATWSKVSTLEPDICLLKTYAPVGICALITPWNFPMVTTSWKVAPALAAGCTVLLKPSEVTLLPELMLGNILSEIELPKGVVNILPGAAEVGTAMTSHPLIDKVSFTGSNIVGEKVMVQAAKGIKDISLELGGKSAIVVYADVDIDYACDLIIGGIFTNAGQICSATSRLIVHQDIAEQLFETLKVKTESLQMGDGFATDTQMGPLVSKQQLNQVQKYFDIAADEHLACLTGGEIVTGSGYFATPTIYTDVPTTSQLWMEEVFGPVLVSTTFIDNAEAVALANDSKFALAATIVCADETAALEMALQIKAGHVWINEQQIVLPEAGWGGFKQSGIGRELGGDGLSAYQKSKHVLLTH